jgi:hypothetical protein
VRAEFPPKTPHDYIDAINVQTIALGRFMFGPEIGYRFRLYGGASFEPFVGRLAFRPGQYQPDRPLCCGNPLHERWTAWKDRAAVEFEWDTGRLAWKADAAAGTSGIG